MSLYFSLQSVENNKNKKPIKFQGDMLNFCDFIQIFVFTTNHHLKGYALQKHMPSQDIVISNFVKKKKVCETGQIHYATMFIIYNIYNVWRHPVWYNKKQILHFCLKNW